MNDQSAAQKTEADEAEASPKLMPAKSLVEFYIAMNEDGEFEVATTPINAAVRLERKHGGALRRMVKGWTLMTPPKITEAYFDTPDEAGEMAEVEIETA